MDVGPAYFVRIHQDAVLPEYKTGGAEGCDIVMPEDFTLLPRQVEYVGTGLICVPPPGYHWEVVLRSSTAMRWPGLFLANAIGIIDHDYIGPQDELKLLLGNFTFSTVFGFKKGDRLTQLILRPNLRPSEIKELTHEEIVSRRSRGGFGSTGI